MFNLGDRPTAYYFVLQGELLIKVREAYGEPLVTIATVQKGEAFGELALTSDKPRH